MKQIFTRLTLALTVTLLATLTCYSQTATITTDLADYPPGSTVQISGSGWFPGETVRLQVTHYMGFGDNTRQHHQPYSTVADADGNVHSTWYIPADEDEIGATLLLTADGISSGLHAEVIFTDAINFDNESLTAQLNTTSFGSPVTADFAYTFKVTGAGNSSIAYAIICTGLPSGVTYTPLTINFTGNGTYTVPIKFSTGAATTGSQITIYASAGSINSVAKTSTLIIGKATPVVTAIGGTSAYNGSPQTGSGSATGISSESLSPVQLMYNGTGSTTYGPVTTAPTNAGTYTVTASFAGNTNYFGATSNAIALTISKAAANIVINPYSNIYDGNAHTASGTASGVGGVDLSSGLSFTTSYSNVPGGTTAWSFNGGTNYNNATGTTDVTISKADANVVITPYTGVYNGNAHTASGTATGVGSADLSSGLSFETSYTNAPGGATNWTFDGGTNYNNQTGATSVTINKATANISIAPYTGVYDGNAHTASGSATGVGGVDLSSGLSFASSYTNVPGGSTNWSFDGGTNYNNESGTSNVTINKATANISITPYTGVYDGNAHTASGSATGVGGVDLSNGLSFATSYTNVPGGSTNWSFDGGTNYNNESGTSNVAINKATANISITPYTGIYDGNAHTASGSATGVGGVDLSSGLSFATSYTNVPGGSTNWSFDGGTNYNNESGTSDITINKATANISITPYTGIYDGNAHTASGSATGVGGVDLSSGLSFATSYTNVPGGSTNWSFDGGTNYNNESGTSDITINKATANISITPYIGIYDGNAHTASGSATGVGGIDLSSGLSFASSYTNVPGGSTNWSFDGGTNYNNESGTSNVTINKATANISITPYTGVYDGNAHTASGSATGVGGVDLSSGLSFATSYTNVPGGSTNWSFDGGTNYNNESGTSDITINKATANISITPYTGVYDGNAHTASGSATGVGGVDLSSGLSFATSYTNVPGGSTNWSFDGGTNYNNESGTSDITINKATANISITPYTGIYDGNAHTASGSATGVGGVDLSSGLSFATSYTNVPGGSTNWSFDGGANYNNESGTSNVTINKATANITITPYTGVYDGNAHTASGSATGVGGVDLSSGLSFATSYTNVPGGSTNWSFDGGTNYNNENGSTTVTINKATAIITITPYSGTYNGLAHTAYGTATGVGGADLSSDLSFATSYTNVPGGSTNWSFDGGTNYNNENGSTTVTINKATLNIIAYNKTRQYSDLDPEMTGYYTGAQNNETFTMNYSCPATATSAPGNYTITPGVTGSTLSNYNVVKTNGTLIITKEDACADYTGTLFANTSSPTGGTATVRLSLVLTEDTDGNSGDVRNATITFTVGGDFTAGTYTASLDPSSTSTRAVFYKDIPVALSSSQLSKVGDVSWKIGGYFTGENCNDNLTEVTVSAPTSDFITGGGYVISDDNAYGKYKGDPGRKTNFGFSVKWNKSFTNIQSGGINSIIRKGNHIYKIKGNKVTSLTITPASGTTPATATFTCNAVLSDIVNDVVIATEGNCTAIIEVTDVCEPGSGARTSSDQIAITVKDKNGVVIYSNNWDAGTRKTIKQELSGGNIQIHSNGKTTTAPVCKTITTMAAVQSAAVPSQQTELPFNVRIGPNPSPLGQDFTLYIQGSSTEKIKVWVVDMTGKPVYQASGTVGNNFRFGSNFTSGVYVVQVSDGSQVRTLKVVKQ
ncbi:T9SS type A sorting domain-containing protein [Flavihumibacter solisilvae]|uniref:T9SS type A sorting domain-containing protein n=1 Tax=Flavihumibacter solisilvae TaxID=1349421 RepID=UPI000AADDD25|nr:T9SS type A sorting domain-containing protein [Flavihumibacter solisilvae]